MAGSGGRTLSASRLSVSSRDTGERDDSVLQFELVRKKEIERERPAAGRCVVCICMSEGGDALLEINGPEIYRSIGGRPASERAGGRLLLFFTGFSLVSSRLGGVAVANF